MERTNNKKRWIRTVEKRAGREYEEINYHNQSHFLIKRRSKLTKHNWQIARQ